MRKRIFAVSMVFALATLLSAAGLAAPGQDGNGPDDQAMNGGQGGPQQCGMMQQGSGGPGEMRGGCPMMKGGHGMMMDGRGHGMMGKHKANHKFWKCPMASRELALTDEQRTKLEDLDAQSMTKLDGVNEELKGLKHQMGGLLDAGTIDMDAVRDLADRIAMKKAEKAEIRLIAKAEALSVLTVEQRGKLKELHAKMKGGMHHGPMAGQGQMGEGPQMAMDPAGLQDMAARIEKEAKDLEMKVKDLEKRAKEIKEKAKKAGKGR